MKDLRFSYHINTFFFSLKIIYGLKVLFRLFRFSLNGPALILVFLVSSCSPSLIDSSESLSLPADHGQFTLFLNGPEKASVDITFNLLAIKAVAEDGSTRDLLKSPVEINSIAVIDRQLILSEKYLPEGKYKKLQLVIEQASIKRKGKKADLSMSDETEVDFDFFVSTDQNTSLFLSWDPDSSVREEYRFKPALSLKGQVPELSSLLIYVSNENSNNVSVINRLSGHVVANIMVGKKPRGIVAAGFAEKRLKVYVANSGSNSISVIDPTTNKVEIEVPIRFGREPEGIAVASVSPANELIFVTNYSSNSVSVIDAHTFNETGKIDVGSGPIAVAVDPPLEDITVTRFLSVEDINTFRAYREKFINLYVLNQNSNDISVIRMNINENSFEVIATLDLEWGPIALSIDPQRAKIYIANHGSDKLSVLDILSIVRNDFSGAVSTISNLQTSIIGIAPDPLFDRIYLLREIPGEIMIIRPFEKGFDTLKTIITPIIGTIRTGSSPRSLIFDQDARKLYVVNSGSDSISVINKTTRREEQVIHVGKKPYGIAIFPY